MNVNRAKLFVFVGIVAAIIAAGALVLVNQSYFEPSKPFIVVLPMWDSPPGRPTTEGFVKGMEKLGYKEGVNIIYKRHGFFAPGPETLGRIKDIYKSDFAEGVDLILTTEYSDTKAAQEATLEAGFSVPIVFTDVTNPIDFGFVKDWVSSGTNLTGVAERRNDVIEKALGLFTATVPGVKRMGAATRGFMLPGEPSISYYEELLKQAPKFGIEIVEYTTELPPGPDLAEEVKKIFGSIQEGDVDAWIHIPGHFFTNQQALEHQLALRLKIPHMLPAIEHNDETGDIVGLFTYGADFVQKGEQGSVIADKILRGAKPSEIPIELPDKYNLMINLKTAEKIGIIVPDEILDIADMIIR